MTALKAENCRHRANCCCSLLCCGSSLFTLMVKVGGKISQSQISKRRSSTVATNVCCCSGQSDGRGRMFFFWFHLGNCGSRGKRVCDQTVKQVVIVVCGHARPGRNQVTSGFKRPTCCPRVVQRTRGRRDTNPLYETIKTRSLMKQCCIYLPHLKEAVISKLSYSL